MRWYSQSEVELLRDLGDFQEVEKLPVMKPCMFHFPVLNVVTVVQNFHFLQSARALAVKCKFEIKLRLEWLFHNIQYYRNRFNCLPRKSHILAFFFPLWFYETHPGRHQHLQDHSLWCNATGDCKWKRLALLCSATSFSTPRNPVTGNLPSVIPS